ncbi:WD repeat-containing protein 89-like [Saccoglossus kowalevskii]
MANISSLPLGRQWTTTLSDLQLAEKAPIASDNRETYIFELDGQLSCNSDGDPLVAAAGSNNSIKIYSRNRLTNVAHLKGHSETLTGIRFGHRNPNLVYTSSRDGTVRCWDVRAKKSKAQQVFTGYPGNKFTSFDVNCTDTIVCAGTESVGEDAYIIFWDCRSTNLLGAYKESHSDDVTQVKFHPTNADALATGSTDGLVCVFDISQRSEENALVTTLNSESSVSRMDWCGANSEYIYCLTHTEQIMIWDAVESTRITKFDDIRQNLGERGIEVEYLVDCFYNSSLKTLVVLGGTHSGNLRLLTVGKEVLHPVNTLNGGHGSTVRCLQWDNSTESLITGGEDGMLSLWTKEGKIEELSKERPQRETRKVRTMHAEKLPKKMQRLKIRHTTKPYKKQCDATKSQQRDITMQVQCDNAKTVQCDNVVVHCDNAVVHCDNAVGQTDNDNAN